MSPVFPESSASGDEVKSASARDMIKMRSGRLQTVTVGERKC